jgi:tRNA(Ile)-lysidine synthase
VDDQVETILHRILRGTGVTGLAGIPRLRLLSPAVTLIRPLLDVARHDVLGYLEELGQTYRHDASNDDSNYTRNRIRQQLLPLLRREYNGQIDEALLRLGSVAQESDEVLRQAAADLLARGLLTQGPAGVCLDVRLLRESPPALARRALALIWQRQGWPERAMSFHQWKRVLALLDGPDLQIILPGAIAASKTETALHLRVQSG